MGNYQRVAELEMERREKGFPARVPFVPVVYGAEKRCPQCWTKLIEHETTDGNVTTYCFNCYSAQNK